MTVVDELGYEAALRRLIDLRFEAITEGAEAQAEAHQLEQEIYAMVRRQRNPVMSPRTGSTED